ncbi:ARM repeat-containing protein [Pholiota conissans]|uniref:ARM repeat-containing protein n=1 Tax=Pholiota conissans TaxID=109636 RepID=A0A9P5ZEL6_9AGAR|nr:ARM repeat-containing protein [Pholiota conissans]
MTTNPMPLDLTNATTRGAVVPNTDLLEAAQFIMDIKVVQYPEGIKGPCSELNQNTKEGKFRYDRDFLLQFMSICKKKPAMLLPLDSISLDPTDRRHTSRSGSGRKGSGAVPQQRQGSFGLGFSPNTVGGRWPTPMTSTANQVGPGAPLHDRKRSKRGEKRDDKSDASGSGQQSYGGSRNDHSTQQALVSQLKPEAMSDEVAKKKIAEDTKEFFAVRNLQEAEVCFIALPSVHHHKLVDSFVSKAVESKEADAQLVADFFAQSTDKCSAAAFEEGFSGLAEFIEDIAIDAPKAAQLFALMIKGAKLDEEARARIAAKSSDSDKLLALLMPPKSPAMEASRREFSSRLTVDQILRNVTEVSFDSEEPLFYCDDEELGLDPSIVERHILSLLRTLNREHNLSEISDKLAGFLNMSLSDKPSNTKYIVDVIIVKATDHLPRSSEYAKLCRRIVDGLHDPGIFQITLVKHCHYVFKEYYDFKMPYTSSATIRRDADRNLSSNANFEEVYSFMQVERQALGVVKFTAGLYNVKILPWSTMLECMNLLLKDPQEQRIEALSMLLRASGQMLERENVYLNWFERIQEIAANNTIISSRAKNMLLTLIEYRDNGWKTPTKEGPSVDTRMQQLPKMASSPRNMYAYARVLNNIDQIQYPNGIKRPDPKLNSNTGAGNSRYDREFLLQFQDVCKECPVNLTLVREELRLEHRERPRFPRKS